MRYRCTADGLSSTLSLTTCALPAYCLARDSTIGASMRHGPHHCAQKSTRTGRLDCNTSCSKFPSFTSSIYSLMKPLLASSLLRSLSSCILLPQHPTRTDTYLDIDSF